MRSCRIKEILSSYLPIELIINILCRLPVKSLMRFKSVSKPWKSLVEDPDFVKSYMDQQHFKTKRLITKYDTSRFQSTDLDSLDKLSIIDMPKLQRSYQQIELIGSSNGLVTLCCTFSNFNDPLVFDFIIWNMATGEHLIIPLELPLPPKFAFLVQGFGYDGVCDDYKVVRAFKSGRGGGEDLKTMVYSLRKHEWVWSTINLPDYHFEDPLVGSLVINGALHWLAFEGYAWDRIIVAFDLNTEEYDKVSLPVNVMADDLQSLKLAVLGDSLCILVDVGDDVDVWVMKNYMVKESWTKVYSLRLKIFPIPLAFSITSDCTTLLLLKYQEFANRAYWYNPSESTIYWFKPSLKEEVHIFVAPSSKFVTAIVYEESLIESHIGSEWRGSATYKWEVIPLLTTKVFSPDWTLVQPLSAHEPYGLGQVMGWCMGWDLVMSDVFSYSIIGIRGLVPALWGSSACLAQTGPWYNPYQPMDRMVWARLWAGAWVATWW